MLNDKKLDIFLDAFLGGRDGSCTEADTATRDSGGSRITVDTDFWDSGEPDAAGLPGKSESTCAPVKRGGMPRRTVFSFIFLAIAVPVTIWAGLRFFGDRKYLMISLAIAVYSMIPFFISFEGRKPQARELLTIAVLVAIAVAGRAAFFMTPNFKPVAAVTIIAGVSFGAESGFMVGSLSMLASNMLFGQGPWTPWQMCAMGLIGFLAGLLFGGGLLKAKKSLLCVFGFLSVLIVFGGIVNIASLTMFFSEVTPASVLMIYMSGLPMDLVHAVSTVIFLWIAARPMLEKLERVKIKYGLLRS